MSNTCNQSTSGNVGDQNKMAKEDFLESPHDLSNIKKVIGVVSGKGGVGKSLLTSMLAVGMKRRGYNVAILDADVTGPSIPESFGIKGEATQSELGLFPVKSETGIEIMSMNLLLKNHTDPVVWRGPLIAGMVKQFWTDVVWNEIDYMFIDMPPGTGDVPLTVFQSIAIDGVIIVTSPQELVSMIVSKAVNMAKMMNIPIIGIIENMSYFKCPDCDSEYKLFGESHLEEIAKEYHIDLTARLPVNQEISVACDKGTIEYLDGRWLDSIGEFLEKMEASK